MSSGLVRLDPDDEYRELPVEMAERITDTLRELAQNVAEQLEMLYRGIEVARLGSAHVVLGYPSWTAYLADIFKTPLNLDRHERRELVGYLSAEGLSTRAIAPIVGASHKTVARDLSTVSTDTVDAPGTLPPQPITGLNGKTYQRPAPKPIVEPTPINEAERRAAEREASINRAARAIRAFLQGWPVAGHLSRSPNRDDILAALDDYDRRQFLTIESEHIR